jgi:UDP-N-acetylmuramate--alanine ligase
VRTISYGFNSKAALVIAEMGVTEGKQKFSLLWKKERLGEFETVLPGRFNLSNIAAAATCALSFNIDVESIAAAIAAFAGTWRRFEYVGKHGNATVVSDYAHHPTAVKETIAGAKTLYPDKKVVAVFQPHQKDRTIKLFDEFAGSFDAADKIVLAEIYEVAGRNDASKQISSNDLVEAIKVRNPNTDIVFTRTLSETEELLSPYVDADTLILIMGAGDIDKIARSLVA